LSQTGQGDERALCKSALVTHGAAQVPASDQVHAAFETAVGDNVFPRKLMRSDLPCGARFPNVAAA